MKIEDKAKEYAKTKKSFNGIEKTVADFAFEAGAEWLRSELYLFLSANPKATVKQITEYLKTL